MTTIKALKYTEDTCTASGGETISATTAITKEGKELDHVHITWTAGTAPTTNEDFVVTLDSALGADHDVPLYTVDPAAESAADIFWRPDDGPIYLTKNDQIKVTYANSDDLGIACAIGIRVR